MNELSLVLYLRLDREKTDSYITYKLPHPMALNEVDQWVENHLPGWDLIQSTRYNPDEQ